MSSKLNKNGGPSGTGQKARIGEAKGQSAHLQKYFTEPVTPNLEKTADEAYQALNFKNPKGDAWKKGKFPQGIFHMGHFLPPDAKDNFMETLLQVTSEGANGPSTKYGVINTSADQIVPYITGKKDKAWYLNTLRTAEYMVDPTDPRTVKNLYGLYPELKDVPDQWYQDMVAIQWALKELLQFGEIRSKDDHALVMHICAPGFIIPRYPAWDPMGVVIEQTTGVGNIKGQAATIKKIATGFKKSNWNPFRYSTEGRDPQEDGNPQDAVNNQQLQWKGMILRRLYPGLREKEDAELMGIITNSLPYTNSATGEFKTNPGDTITDNMRTKPRPSPWGMYDL